MLLIWTSLKGVELCTAKSVQYLKTAVCKFLVMASLSSCSECCLILSQTTNLDSFKLKEFADDNFEFDENIGKFSIRVKNTVGK